MGTKFDRYDWADKSLPVLVLSFKMSENKEEETTLRFFLDFITR